MKLFGKTPGVEWSPDASDSTMPMTPSSPQFEVFPQLCSSCQGEVGIDGYCLTCGQKARSLREHYELTLADWVSGVCDIGQAHPRNEDALACQADANRAVIVVCDGVTTSEDSDQASMAAAHAACSHLWTTDPQGLGTVSSRTAAVNAAITDSITIANQAVIDATDPTSQNSAATTIAIAVVDRRVAYCANVGDSRIYWLPDQGEPRQVTRDHSLAQDGMDSGSNRHDAESSPLAHTITRWLGRDAVNLAPYLARVDLDDSGWLIVCSDGLWNYVSEAQGLATLVNDRTAEETARDLASRLVSWANEQGGRDNITVACIRVHQAGPSSTQQPCEKTDPEPTPATTQDG